jgi:hypothetical protein
MPLKAAEIISHPAFDTVEWVLPPTKEGYAEVAKGRAGGPFKLYYEIHGQGDVKLVVGAFKIPQRLFTSCAMWWTWMAADVLVGEESRMRCL